MEDDYELVPKALISSLKKENETLKAELENRAGQKHKETKQDFAKLLQDMRKAFMDESKNERELVLKGLEDIKDLNKKTLDNIVTKTDSYENKMETMIESLGELIGSVTQIADEISRNFESLKGISEFAESKKEDIKSNAEVMFEMKEKLDEINLFMKNLRVLLSYVRANDFKTNSSQ